MTSPPAPRLVVAVPTFRRPAEVARLVPDLLDHLDAAARSGAARGRLVVIDNDPSASARGALEPWLPRLTYLLEPRPGISAARNRALDEARGDDLLAFIDDDERPGAGWLALLLATRRTFDAAAVAGPVRSLFEGELDPWFRAGGFFERRHRHGLVTGTPIGEAATNNLLLDLRVVRALDLRFAADLGLTGGEDSLFTKALTGAGGGMVWCAEAEVTEVVPAHRLSRRWVLLRQVSSGNSAALVDLRVSASPAARARTRARYLTGGALRLLGGLARAGLGQLVRRPVHQARGLRAAARGLGMLGGSVGWRYQEYRRPVAATPAVPDPAVGSRP